MYRLSVLREFAWSGSISCFIRSLSCGGVYCS